VILWPIGLAVAGVFFVFRSAGVDYRTVALGSLLPLIVDVGFDHRAFGHTLLAAVIVLAIVMLATIGRGRRLTRRRWLGVPIGLLFGLIASGVFTETKILWWPTAGTSFGHSALLPAWPAVLGLELLGAVLLVAVGSRTGLRTRDAQLALWRTGRLAEQSTGPTRPAGGGARGGARRPAGTHQKPSVRTRPRDEPETPSEDPGAPR
jgi:membrane-bound metal-dependent hydrolase YbcI (DUF457 family)